MPQKARTVWWSAVSSCLFVRRAANKKAVERENLVQKALVTARPSVDHARQYLRSGQAPGPAGIETVASSLLSQASAKNSGIARRYITMQDSVVSKSSGYGEFKPEYYTRGSPQDFRAQEQRQAFVPAPSSGYLLGDRQYESNAEIPRVAYRTASSDAAWPSRSPSAFTSSPQSYAASPYAASPSAAGSSPASPPAGAHLDSPYSELRAQLNARISQRRDAAEFNRQLTAHHFDEQ